MSLFGTDGIRGVAGKPPFTVETLKAIGFASGQILLSKQAGNKTTSPVILIGRDTRESGPWIEEALSEGLSLSGCQVYCCGVIPTAAISVLLKRNHFLGGSVISASHNPPEFNGVKFFSSDGGKILESWEKEIGALVLKLGAGTKLGTVPLGTVPNFISAESDYVQFLKEACTPSFSMKGVQWVLDCANGSASLVAPKIFKFLEAELITIGDKPNGKNINVGCGALHLDLLREAVVKNCAFGGGAFDGDADRVLFVDEKGEILDGDLLIALAAEDLKEKGELTGNCVVATVMANFGFFQWMKRAGIKVITTPVGDRSVSEKILETGAKLGGEQSGHIIFGQYLSTGDGLLTALKILQTLVAKGKKLSHYREIYPKTPQVLLNLKVKEKVPIENLPNLNQLIQSCKNNLGENGRLLVRYSGTEPLLRIMVEGSSLSEIQKMASTIAESAKAVLQ